MASRGFFGYDPYDSYYYGGAAPSGYFAYDPYDDDYYQRRPAQSTRRSEPAAAAKPMPRPNDSSTSFDIPIHGPDSDPEPEPEREQKATRAGPAMSAEEATVRMQAAARGFLARKSVRTVRVVDREAEQVRAKMEMASEAEALATDPRARVAVGDALMKMVLRLDDVRGARDYRGRVTRRLLALLDAVDALETMSAPALEPASMGVEVEADAPDDATTVEMAEEIAVTPEPADAAERGSEMESIKTAIYTPTQTEVATGELEAEEPVLGDAKIDVDEQEDSDAEEGEWEMVTEEKEHTSPVADTSSDQEPPLEITRTASVGTGAATDGFDMSKVMEMVTALCEQSAKQGAVISALAMRVDALERTVRWMEEAESHRRQAKEEAK